MKLRFSESDRSARSLTVRPARFLPMPSKKAAERRPTQEDMLRAEREVGENLPDEVIGVEGADVGQLHRKGKDVELLIPEDEER